MLSPVKDEFIDCPPVSTASSRTFSHNTLVNKENKMILTANSVNYVANMEPILQANHSNSILNSTLSLNSRGGRTKSPIDKRSLYKEKTHCETQNVMSMHSDVIHLEATTEDNDKSVISFEEKSEKLGRSSTFS